MNLNLLAIMLLVFYYTLMNLDILKIGKTIGEGTFGKVKLGVHILTGEKV